MKQITTIILAVLALACTAQEPDIECYSVGYVDSIKSEYELRIEILSSVLQSDVYETPEDSCILISDDGNIRAEIIKEGLNIWVNIIDGNKRINSDYINSESRVIIMNDSVTIGSLYINSDNTKGSSFIDF